MASGDVSQPKDTPSPSAVKVVKICVFCGSSPGKSPARKFFTPILPSPSESKSASYPLTLPLPTDMEAARALAKVMARNNIQLVYGGGTVGLSM